MELPLDKFWFQVKSEYPTISDRAILTLLLFSITYICQLSLSTSLTIKNKKRSYLKELGKELKIALS